MKLLFKVLGVVFSVLFAVGAVVQYNDPDSLFWIVIYLLASILALGAAFNKINTRLLIGVGVVCLVGFLYLYPSDFQGFDLNDGDIKVVELGREAFGLLIISLVMLLYGFKGRK